MENRSENEVAIINESEECTLGDSTRRLTHKHVGAFLGIVTAAIVVVSLIVGISYDASRFEEISTEIDTVICDECLTEVEHSSYEEVRSYAEPTSAYITKPAKVIVVDKPTDETRVEAPTTTLKTEVLTTAKTTISSDIEVKPVENTKGYTDYELELVARTTYCEAGICSEYCQWLVASTVLNLADRYGGIASVTSNRNMFNVAGIIWNKTPSQLSYSVARRVLEGDRDYNVMAFRTNHYHNFGKPYTSVGNVYFSTY